MFQKPNMFQHGKSLLNHHARIQSLAGKDYSQLTMLKRLISSFSRSDVQIPVPLTGGHIAVQLWEGGKGSTGGNPPQPTTTPIICMHGVQDNSCSFDPLIPLILKDNMRVVSVDQTGHGLSSHTTGAVYDFLVDGVVTIHRVMRHFQWEKIILMGHSFGSILSFVFTGSNPEKVEKYIALDNLHVIERDPVQVMEKTYKTLFSVEDKLRNPNIKKPSYTFEDIFQRVNKARKGTVTKEGLNTLLKRGAMPDPINANMFQFTHDLRTTIPSQFGRYTYEQSKAIASHIRCPVCFIKGDPGEDYEPRERLMGMFEEIKKANSGKTELHYVPGTHHFHLNQPELVAPLVSKFLEKKFN